MADRMQVYKCEICGNIVEVLHAGKGVLVCCNQPMNLMSETQLTQLMHLSRNTFR
jgi:superoxide reductase